MRAKDPIFVTYIKDVKLFTRLTGVLIQIVILVILITITHPLFLLLQKSVIFEKRNVVLNYKKKWLN